MDQDSAHMVAASKEVIKNGATLPKTQVVDGVITVMLITTTKEKAQRRLEMKARRTLIMGILNKYQLKFNSIKDAKKLLEAVEKKFVNITNGVSTASTQVNVVDNLSDVVICAFLASQPNSPQLAHKDLEQIYPDDIEEMDLRWQMDMLTIRVRRFLKKTVRKLTVNGNESLGFDMSKVECYNCHKREYFARECRAPRNQETKHKESTRRSVPVETPASIALVSCDGLGRYDWSDQAEEGPNYALMAYTSLISYSKPLVKNKTSEEDTKAVRKNTDALTIEECVSDGKEENLTQPKIIKKIVRPIIVKKEFVKPRQQEKTARKTVKKVEHNRQNIYRPRGNQRNWNNMMSQKLGSNFEMFNKACY
nr:hypothetical protein [Tanacetum cinerariifolium]